MPKVDTQLIFPGGSYVHSLFLPTVPQSCSQLSRLPCGQETMHLCAWPQEVLPYSSFFVWYSLHGLLIWSHVKQHIIFLWSIWTIKVLLLRIDDCTCASAIYIPLMYVDVCVYFLLSCTSTFYSFFVIKMESRWRDLHPLMTLLWVAHHFITLSIAMPLYTKLRGGWAWEIFEGRTLLQIMQYFQQLHVSLQKFQ